MTHNRNSIRFKPTYDGFTVAVIAFAALICFGLPLLDFDWISFSICVIAFLLIFIPFFSIYYVIDGDMLFVHYCYISNRYPISEIREIKPTKSIISAPAPSLSGRIAIYFNRKAIKSSMPLVISPAECREFINRLTEINPDIKVEGIR